MSFDLKTPCDACPFLKNSPIRLTSARASEIADYMLLPHGSTFPCHKTVKYCGAEGSRCAPGTCKGHEEIDKAQHCAGALIFAEKNGNQTQMMRIAGRLRMYDPSALKGFELVFDNKRQMVKFHKAPAARKTRRA